MKRKHVASKNSAKQKRVVIPNCRCGAGAPQAARSVWTVKSNNQQTNNENLNGTQKDNCMISDGVRVERRFGKKIFSGNDDKSSVSEFRTSTSDENNNGAANIKCLRMRSQQFQANDDLNAPKKRHPKESYRNVANRNNSQGKKINEARKDENKIGKRNDQSKKGKNIDITMPHDQPVENITKVPDLPATNANPPKSKVAIQNKSDKGCLDFKKGEVILDKYALYHALGEGGYGLVLKSFDIPSGKFFALKIIKNKSQNLVASKEVENLEMIAKFEPQCDFVAKMLNWFYYQSHICIAFELYGQSVYHFQRANNCEPFPFEQIRYISFQLCSAVKFLHANGLVHTDIKSANIVFVNDDYTTRYHRRTKRPIRFIKNADIKLIDFASATSESEEYKPVVTTRHYRAPEIALKLSVPKASDVWSIGCTLFELYSGKILFKPKDTRFQLAVMERILGPIPKSMALATTSRFFQNGKLDLSGKYASAEFFARKSGKPLMSFCSFNNNEHKQLFELILKMLMYKPVERINLEEALRHEFFSKPIHYHRKGCKAQRNLLGGCDDHCARRPHRSK